jgi:hypothetical protein
MRYYACQLSRQGGGYLHDALPVCCHALLRVTSVYYALVTPGRVLGKPETRNPKP